MQAMLRESVTYLCIASDDSANKRLCVLQTRAQSTANPKPAHVLPTEVNVLNEPVVAFSQTLSRCIPLDDIQ